MFDINAAGRKAPMILFTLIIVSTVSQVNGQMDEPSIFQPTESQLSEMSSSFSMDVKFIRDGNGSENNTTVINQSENSTYLITDLITVDANDTIPAASVDFPVLPVDANTTPTVPTLISYLTKHKKRR